MLLFDSVIKLVRILLRSDKKKQRTTLADYQRELLVRQGREQFKKLIDRGLGVPVGLL